MSAADNVAIASACLAAFVAIWVPWLAFRYTLRQEQSRWLREQRAELYADLLTEGYAEQEFLLNELQAEAGMRSSSTASLMLPPLERARLGARGTMYASQEVMRLFNKLERIHPNHTILRDRNTTPVNALQSARVAMTGAMEDLQAAIRKEMGTDQIKLHTGER
jgi:hypothetical protein